MAQVIGERRAASNTSGFGLSYGNEEHKGEQRTVKDKRLWTRRREGEAGVQTAATGRFTTTDLLCRWKLLYVPRFADGDCVCEFCGGFLSTLRLADKNLMRIAIM